MGHPNKWFRTVASAAWLFIASLSCLAGARATVARGNDLTQLVHRTWTLESGLPQATPHPIVQTPDGFIWFGTEEGLVRFDGIEFRTYSPANASLPGRFVTALAVDTVGNLWIGFEGGLAHFDGTRLHKWTTEQGLADGNVRAIYIGDDQEIWVGTRNGLQLFNSIETARFETFTVDDGLSSNQITAIGPGPAGDLLIGTQNGLNVFDGETFTVFDTSNGLSSEIVTDVLHDAQGRIWCATNDGLNIITNGKIASYREEAGFPTTELSTLHRDHSGNTWVGTQNGGIGIFAKGRFHNQGEALKFTWGILDIFEDRDGNLWLGTQGEGLHQFRQGKLTTLLPNGAGATNVTVSAFRDLSGEIWVGTTTGLSKWNKNRFIDIDITSIGQKAIPLAIGEAYNGRVWFGGQGPGLFRVSAKGIDRVINAQDDGLSNDSVRAIYDDGRGNLYVGTILGFNHFKNGKLQRIFRRADGLPDDRVSAIVPAEDGAYWLATPSGLAHFDGINIEGFVPSKNVSQNRVLFLYRENEDRLWFGTLGGLGLYHNGAAQFISTEQGLHNNSVYTIMEDATGLLWMSSNNGISSVRKQSVLDFFAGLTDSVTSTAYGVADGLKSRECNGGYQSSSAVDGEGRMWFANMQGVAIVDTSRLAPNRQPPSVIIDTVRADDASDLLEGVALAPETSRFEFHYTALSFDAPRKIQFLTRMRPIEDEWIPAGTQRLRQFTNLDPQVYEFQVNACNADGFCTEQPDTFEFELLPFWYQTLTAQLSFIIGGILLLLGLGYLWIRFARHRQHKLSELVWERTRRALASQVEAVRSVSKNINDAAGEMQTLMTSLAISSEQVSSSMTETASTIEQIGRTSNETEQRTKQIVSAATRAEQASLKGRGAVNESTTLMQQIESDAVDIVEKGHLLFSSLTQIDSIAAMVKDIANQSKLLAINASIEAAKAGDAGRGFGVVAKKMRSLAIQSKESTSEIGHILSAIRGSVGRINTLAEAGQLRTQRGVGAIERAGVMVTNLSLEMEENANLANGISQSIDQQITGLNHIVYAANNIKEEMRSNTSKSRQVEDRILLLNESISTLHEMVNNWETPEFYRRSR